jgi:hypothetical protein
MDSHHLLLAGLPAHPIPGQSPRWTATGKLDPKLPFAPRDPARHRPPVTKSCIRALAFSSQRPHSTNPNGCLQMKQSRYQPGRQRYPQRFVRRLIGSAILYE